MLKVTNQQTTVAFVNDWLLECPRQIISKVYSDSDTKTVVTGTVLAKEKPKMAGNSSSRALLC